MAVGILLLLGMGIIAASADVNQGAPAPDVVDATNKTLKDIPEGLSQNILKLILSNNFIQLSSSDMDVLGTLKMLTELHLNSNLITALPPKLLSCLPQLRILNLSHNNISVLEPTALSEQTFLTELDLSHNHILSLPQGAFVGLTSLKRLQLQGNQLKTLEKETVLRLGKLQQLALEDNPWECSCEFVSLMKQMNSSGLLLRTQATCVTPSDRFGKSILDDTMCFFKSSTAPIPTVITTPTSTASSIPTKSSNNSRSSGDSASDKGTGSGGDITHGGIPLVGNTWKFLVGVVVIALSTSVLIVCAVKSPSWYKLIFNYRHQRLREEGGPSVLAKGRYSNFSLETEQTETSAHELDEGLDCEVQMEDEDEDGFIEDRYIDPGDFKEQNEP